MPLTRGAHGIHWSIFFVYEKALLEDKGEKVIFLGREKKKMCHPLVAFSSRSEATFHFAETFKSVLSLSAFFCVWFQLSGHEKTGSELRLARLNNDPFCHQRGLGDEIAF